MAPSLTMPLSQAFVIKVSLGTEQDRQKASWYYGAKVELSCSSVLLSQAIRELAPSQQTQQFLCIPSDGRMSACNYMQCKPGACQLPGLHAYTCCYASKMQGSSCQSVSPQVDPPTSVCSVRGCTIATADGHISAVCIHMSDQPNYTCVI